MMFYIGANDQRVSVVNEAGAEVYHCDFRGFSAVITHFRGRIAAIALSNSAGEVDKTILKVRQMKMGAENHPARRLATQLFAQRFAGRCLLFFDWLGVFSAGLGRYQCR